LSVSTHAGERSQTQLDAERSRLGPPTRSLRALTDRGVLLAGRRARIAENKANGERWLCFVEFYPRRLATEAQKRAASPHFALTARQETVVEIGSLWGMDAARASLAGMIAHEPGGTWHRMLTDEAGRQVELSTKRYQPTGPIWQHVVAEHGTWFRPGCDAPSTEGDLDHRIAWPIGATDTTNLWLGGTAATRLARRPGSCTRSRGRPIRCRTTSRGPSWIRTGFSSEPLNFATRSRP
jgi:hypothetical protein